jgi:CDP-paratose 2-epimerase
MREHYPGWDITVTLEQTMREIVEAWERKRG